MGFYAFETFTPQAVSGSQNKNKIKDNFHEGIKHSFWNKHRKVFSPIKACDSVKLFS